VQKTVVINAVGLTSSLIGPHTPRLAKFRDANKLAHITPSLPAVTTTVQTTYLTGVTPAEHGVIANGWYYRDDAEVHFWKQSSRLIQRPRLWDIAKQRDPRFTCANMFWWYAMYSNADYTVTPRPMYPADGRKLPDVWTNPPRLRDSLQQKLGQFPLFKFWGPATSIECTQWIADATVEVDKQYDPTLTLVYLPHLDYAYQRRGPGASENATDLAELDQVCGQLFDHFQSRSAKIIVLSEYGITPVSRPVHLNREFRKAGLITVREEMGHEILDCGASAAFAVADHQIAHIYVNDPSRLSQIQSIVERTPGVARVLDEHGKKELSLNHLRAGDLVALADRDAWFTYYFWEDDAKAPDYARTVDIHRKPGYDPVELFLDPAIKNPKLRIAQKLLLRKLGQRALLDVIPLDASLVKGSHGLLPERYEEGPLLIGDHHATTPVPATDVCGLILDTVFKS